MAHNCDSRGPGYSFCCSLFGYRGIGHFLLGLLFETDDVCFRAEEARHFAGEFGVEGLIDSRKHTASEQPRNEVLRANVEFLGKILDADAFGDGDVAGDRHRLVRDHHARWWNVALHRAFFDSTRNVALTRTP